VGLKLIFFDHFKKLVTFQPTFPKFAHMWSESVFGHPKKSKSELRNEMYSSLTLELATFLSWTMEKNWPDFQRKSRGASGGQCVGLAKNPF